MISFDDKALNLAEDILDVLGKDYKGGASQQKAAIQLLIISALRKQDRDTRHACADEVAKLPARADNADFIFVIDAMNACINTK